jgi:hypothetical protein
MRQLLPREWVLVVSGLFSRVVLFDSNLHAMLGKPPVIVRYGEELEV